MAATAGRAAGLGGGRGLLLGFRLPGFLLRLGLTAATAPSQASAVQLSTRQGIRARLAMCETCTAPSEGESKPLRWLVTTSPAGPWAERCRARPAGEGPLQGALKSLSHSGVQGDQKTVCSRKYAAQPMQGHACACLCTPEL